MFLSVDLSGEEVGYFSNDIYSKHRYKMYFPSHRINVGLSLHEHIYIHLHMLSYNISATSEKKMRFCKS